MTNAALLALRNVSVVFASETGPPVQAVQDVDLNLNMGQIVGLVGESGCGKSTLARAACGLIEPNEGSVELDGSRVRPIGHRGRTEAERRIQMIFQDPQSSLNPRRTIGAQIEEGFRLSRDAPRETWAELAGDQLERVGIARQMHSRYPHEFSGGQQQRISIARALSAKPTVLIADEPTSALDASSQAEIANLLRELSNDVGLGILFISHDLSLVEYMADVVYVMYLGRIVERGDARRVWKQPAHPYTEALILSHPHPEKPGLLPMTIEGDVPDPANPPSGCNFHPRCPVAYDECVNRSPTLVSRDGDQWGACHLWSAGVGGRAEWYTSLRRSADNLAERGLKPAEIASQLSVPQKILAGWVGASGLSPASSERDPGLGP